MWCVVMALHSRQDSEQQRRLTLKFLKWEWFLVNSTHYYVMGGVTFAIRSMIVTSCEDKT